MQYIFIQNRNLSILSFFLPKSFWENTNFLSHIPIRQLHPSHKDCLYISIGQSTCHLICLVSLIDFAVFPCEPSVPAPAFFSRVSLGGHWVNCYFFLSVLNDALVFWKSWFTSKRWAVLHPRTRILADPKRAVAIWAYGQLTTCWLSRHSVGIRALLKATQPWEAHDVPNVSQISLGIEVRFT